MKSILAIILVALLTSCTQGQTAKSVRTDTLVVNHLAKKGSDTLATLSDLRANSGFVPGTGDIEAVTVTAPITGGNTSGTANIGIDTTAAFAYIKHLLSLGGADSSIFATRFFTGATYAPLATYLTPADSTRIRNYCNALYLKNADSTTLKNALLKNADSTSMRNYSASLYATKISPTITGNPNLNGASTLRLFTGAGLLTSASDGYVAVTVTPAIGAATGTSLALGGASLGTNALAVTGTMTLSSTFGLGTTTPFHLLSGKTTGTAGFNLTNSTYNTVVSSEAQEEDTSAITFDFTSGNPVFTMKNAIGVNTFQVGGSGTATAYSFTYNRSGGSMGYPDVQGTTGLTFAESSTKATQMAMKSTGVNIWGNGAFNVTSLTNTTVSSAAQEKDTSSVNVTYSPGGDPELELRNAQGGSMFKVDSAGNAHASGNVSAGGDTLKNKLEKSAFADSNAAHSIGVGPLTLGEVLVVAGTDSIRSRDSIQVRTAVIDSGDIKFTGTGEYGLKWLNGSCLYEQPASMGLDRLILQPNGSLFQILTEDGNTFVSSIATTATTFYRQGQPKIKLSAQGTSIVFELHTIAAGDSVFGNTFIRDTDSVMVSFNGTGWTEIKKIAP
jgi:hypothetical protein